MLFTRSATPLILALALFAAACNSEESLPQLDVEQGAEPVQQQRRVGALLAEYDPGRVEGTSVYAQFLDVRGVSVDTALEALEIWSPDRALDLDACSVRAPLSERTEANEVQLHLLDVGPITVDGADGVEGAGRATFHGRRLPDLLAGFSGVVYGSDESLDAEPTYLPYIPHGYYRVAAQGRDETGGFTVGITAPTVPQIEAVGVVDDDVRMRWASDNRTDASELYLDVTGGHGVDRPRLRCRLEDDGEFVLPTAIVEQVVDGDAAIEFVLRRVHVHEVVIDGLDESSFVFAATDGVLLSR